MVICILILWIFQNKKASIAQISLNTPGSKVDRAILLEVELNYPKQTFEANMRSPWKKVAFKGKVILYI